MKKRILSALLTLCMALSLLPGAAGAAEATSIPATSASITRSVEMMNEGDIETWLATVEPSNTTDTPTWSSSNEAVLTVSETGKVTAVSPGEAKITVKAGAYSVTSDTVTVSGLVIEPATLELYVNTSDTLTCQPYGYAKDLIVTWSSSNISVAGIKDGKVTAYNPGTATITATAGSYKATCKVIVTENVADAVPATMNVGEAYCLGQLITELDKKSVEMTGYSLDYVTGLTVTTSAGILFYGYNSSDVPGSGVGGTQSYYVSPSGNQNGLSDVYFVPAVDFDGTAVISYTGYASGVNFSGTIRVSVVNSGDVVLNTAQERVLTFAVEDFAAVCRATTGRTLRYVTFRQPNSSHGTLYYNYSTIGQFSPRVSEDVKYYTSGGNMLLENVSFLPADGFSGKVTIPYSATDSADVTYSGTITIHVSATAADSGSGGVKNIVYETAPGEAASFSVSDFNSVCLETTGANLNYVYFTLPKSSEGALYYNYSGSASSGSLVSATRRYFRSSSPRIGYVDFVPADGFTGTVTIAYTAYDTTGECYDGNVVIHVDGAVGTVFYATTAGREITFDGLDFNEVCQDANGASLDYICFELPASSRGVLYYNYSSSSSTRLTASRKCYRSTLSNVSFVPRSSFTGTVNIYFSGYDTEGSRFSGIVEITVTDGEAEDTLYYTVPRGEMVQFSAADFNEVSRALTGSNLNYVRFDLPSSRYGTLYHNYGASGNDSTKVRTSTNYYRNSSSRLLDDVSFVPASNFSGMVTLSYVGRSTSGENFTGYIEITVTAVSIPVVTTPTVTVLSYNGSSLPVRLKADDFRSSCAATLPQSLSCIRFKSTPSSLYGKLLVDYSGPGTGTQVTAGTAYYTTATVSSIDDLCFVAKAGYTGTVTLYYTAEDVAGNTVDGNVLITISDSYLPNTFNDTAGCAWAIPAIEFLYDSGVTNGVGDGSYGAYLSISRGDCILMLNRIFEFKNRTGTNFSDVSSGSHYAQAVLNAKLLGIITGDADGNYHPNTHITRQDALLAIYRAMKVAGWTVPNVSTAVLAAYPDGDQVTGEARSAMAAMIGMGIIYGGSDNNLNPNSNLSRAEFAVILHRLLTL